MSQRNGPIVVCVLLLTAAAVLGGSLELKKRAGDYDVSVTIDKNPPVVGRNTIEIGIRDPAGAPVLDAEVLVNYYMPPMPRMAPMNYRVEAKMRGGTYKARMDLIMAGPWYVAVKITRKDKTVTAKFNIDAR